MPTYVIFATIEKPHERMLMPLGMFKAYLSWGRGPLAYFIILPLEQEQVHEFFMGNSRIGEL